MATDLALHALIEEAKRVGHHRTSKDAVAAALKAYVACRRRLDILATVGTVTFESDYEYKAGRQER